MTSKSQPAARNSSPSADLQLPTSLPCHLCRRAAECKRCGACNGVWYCGRDCQRRDWPSHRAHCQQLQEVRRWATFAEHLGGQFCELDDRHYASAPRDLSSLPALPHLVLGTVASSGTGQVHLNTWRFSRERPSSIPIVIMDEHCSSAEKNPEVLQASYRQLFGGQPLEVAVKSGLPVAVKRSCLHNSGFQLPSVIHTNRSNSPFGKEQFVFVMPSAATSSSAASAKKNYK